MQKNLPVQFYSVMMLLVMEMKGLLNKIITSCTEKGWIDPSDAEWVRYGLERLVSTVCGFSAMLLIGLLLFPFPAVLAFLGSFCFLRKRTNGFHAKTMAGCFFSSIGIELLVLGAVYPFLSTSTSAILLTFSSMGVLVLAPFRHPNFPLTEREFAANATGTRVRLLILLVLYTAFYWLQWEDAARGISLGIATDCAMLVLAYITKKGETHHEKH